MIKKSNILKIFILFVFVYIIVYYEIKYISIEKDIHKYEKIIKDNSLKLIQLKQKINDL